MIKNTYSIKKVYEELLGKNPRIPWAITIWNRASLPRACFIWWLAIQDYLKMTSRLKAIGCYEKDFCPMCITASESINHINFNCPFSFKCLEGLMVWLDIHIQTPSL